MNAQQVINEMEGLDRIEKQIYSKYAEIFDRDTPEALYLNFYELAWGVVLQVTEREVYPGNPETTPELWEKFLDIPEIYRYRMSKIAKLAEYDATKAMQKLGSSSDNVQALKEIIKTSKAMTGGKQNQTVVISYVTPKRRESNV